MKEHEHDEKTRRHGALAMTNHTNHANNQPHQPRTGGETTEKRESTHRREQRMGRLREGKTKNKHAPNT